MQAWRSAAGASVAVANWRQSGGGSQSRSTAILGDEEPTDQVAPLPAHLLHNATRSESGHEFLGALNRNGGFLAVFCDPGLLLAVSLVRLFIGHCLSAARRWRRRPQRRLPSLCSGRRSCPGGMIAVIGGEPFQIPSVVCAQGMAALGRLRGRTSWRR